MKHSLDNNGGGNRKNSLLNLSFFFFLISILLVSDLISALFFLIHEGLHYKCYMPLIRLRQLLICVSGKQNYLQHYQTEELSVHALRHTMALYLMLLMYNINGQKMACIM